MNVIGYCRYSRRPTHESESNELQKEEIERYCAEHGYQLLAVYGDEEKAGDEEADRPALWSAVAGLKPGMVLVVHKPDRLARSVYLTEFLRREIKSKKASLECVTGGRNGSSAEDVFVSQILAAFAEYEKKVIAARIKAAMIRHQANGRCITSHPPLGYTTERRWDEGKKAMKRFLIPDKHEQAAMAVIRQAHQDGVGIRTISSLLKSAGYRGRGKGGRWSLDAIMRVLNVEKDGRKLPPV